MHNKLFCTTSFILGSMKDVDAIDFEWAGLSLQLYPVEGSASLSDGYTVSPSSCVASLLGNETWLTRVTRLGVRIWKTQKLLILEKYWQNFWWRNVTRHFNKNTTHISKDCESFRSLHFLAMKLDLRGSLDSGSESEKTVHRNNRDWKNKNLTKECYWSPQQTHTHIIAGTAPWKFFKFCGGYHWIWRYGEAQGVQEVQKNTFGKYSTEGIPR